MTNIVQLPVTVSEVADEIIELWLADVARAPAPDMAAAIRAYRIAEARERIGPLWHSLDSVGMRQEVEARLHSAYDLAFGRASTADPR